MSSITLDQMRTKLLTLDQVAETLSATEPLTTERVTSDSKIHFTLPDGWNADLDTLAGTDVVTASMRINGTEHALTKDAALMAAATVGLPGAYVRKTPGNLIEPHLNYWFSGGMGSKEFNVLSVADNIAAFVRPTLVPFSNVNLLEAATAGIRQQYGESTEILADYKILNTLQGTDIRLIVPEHQRTMTDTHMTDTPTGEADLWSAGIHLSNSLTGKRQTAVEAYLFRWWCTNGCTTSMADVGAWSRRVDGQESDVFVWAADAVNEVLGGMEHKFDEVQALAHMNVAGNTADILREIFSQYEVPVSQRDQIMATLLEAENLTMYTIMQAITQVANGNEIDPRRADRMMRIGGAIPTTTFDLVKAKVWGEGHVAEPESSNPYFVG